MPTRPSCAPAAGPWATRPWIEAACNRGSRPCSSSGSTLGPRLSTTHDAAQGVGHACGSCARRTRRRSPLFSGKNLDGWVNVTTAPSTWSIEDGLLHCSAKPIGELRTTKMYQNSVMELEWRHLKLRGNVGIFIWADDITARGVPFHPGIEVQVLENDHGNTKSHTTHGDIFSIHGARMTPINGRGGSRAFPQRLSASSAPSGITTASRARTTRFRQRSTVRS